MPLWFAKARPPAAETTSVRRMEETRPKESPSAEIPGKLTFSKEGDDCVRDVRAERGEGGGGVIEPSEFARSNGSVDRDILAADEGGDDANEAGSDGGEEDSEQGALDDDGEDTAGDERGDEVGCGVGDLEWVGVTRGALW